MLTFSRSFIRQLRILFSRTLGLSWRELSQPVQFSAGPHGLIIRTQRGLLTAQYRESTPQPPRELITSLALLKAVEDTKAEPVTLVATDDGLITARGPTGPVLSATSPPLDPEAVFPGEPDRWQENPPELWSALAAAQGTTDPQATRYALGCIQLRGGSGVLAATDGSQLFRQAGFQFGWEDEVLIPGSKLFTSSELPRDLPLAVGQIGQNIAFRAGPWTFWLPIREGRFPRVDDVVPGVQQVTTVLSLPPAQREFLQANLPRLKCPGPYEPVTLDLNGHVAIRSRESAAVPPTELVLQRATYTGPEVCLVSNRRYLQRALELGFSELGIPSPTAPFVCRAGQRDYVWMPVALELAVKATADTVRIESPDRLQTRASRTRRSAPVKVYVPTLPREPSTPMPTTQSTDSSSAATPVVRRQRPRPTTQVSLIEQCVAVRTKLRELLVETNELLRAAKRQRQQERLVRSTLASLKQLQAAG